MKPDQRRESQTIVCPRHHPVWRLTTRPVTRGNKPHASSRLRVPLRRRRRTQPRTAAPGGRRSRAEESGAPQNWSGQITQPSWIRQSRTTAPTAAVRADLSNPSSPRRSRRETPSSSSGVGRALASSRRHALGHRRARPRRARWGHGRRVAPDGPPQGLRTTVRPPGSRCRQTDATMRLPSRNAAQ